MALFDRIVSKNNMRNTILPCSKSFPQQNMEINRGLIAQQYKETIARGLRRHELEYEDNAVVDPGLLILCHAL